MGLALCINCPNFANPIARLQIWIYSCQIAMSFCCVMSRKRKQTYLVCSLPFGAGGAALSGIEVTGGSSMDVPSTGLCLYTFQCTEGICGCQQYPAKLVGEEGHCQCLCHPWSLMHGTKWEVLRNKYVWLLVKGRESNKNCKPFHGQQDSRQISVSKSGVSSKYCTSSRIFLNFYANGN